MGKRTSISGDDTSLSSFSSFSVLDVVRILGGLVLLNVFGSWWFTSTGTWGYDGKWIDPRFWHFQLAGQYVVFSEDQLASFDGTDPLLPVYIGINGSVYDVTAARRLYGPKGPYHKLAGKDCARVYVTGCLMKQDEYTHDLRELDQWEIDQQLGGWIEFYSTDRRYWYVGNVTHESPTGPVPGPCEHMRRPGS